MSLYGSGRSEGIGAAAIIAAYVLLVHWLGTHAADTAPGEPTQRVLFAALPALGGALCYRFLRAQGRSRYAAFLVGAAYGASPWLAALALAPRELMAAALAPLALEATCRFDRPGTRRAWLPWGWVCIAAPFLGGNSSIAWFCASLCALGLVRTAACGDRDANLPPPRLALWTMVGAGLAIANLCWLELLGPTAGVQAGLTSNDVLTLHRAAHGLDLAAALRVPGPLLLLFAALGLLRRQRHVDLATWVAVAVAGALPTLFATLPLSSHATPLLTYAPTLAATSWWLTLLAAVVLGTAGLDDFLDLPLRRRTALPWLLAICVVLASVLPALGTRAPEREWPLTMGLPALAALLLAWRRLGILRFKNVLAATALMVASLPLLQALPGLCERTALPTPTLPAAPLVEVMDVGTEAPALPIERAIGLLAALVLTTLLAALDRWHVARTAAARTAQRGAALKVKRRS